MSAAKEAPVQRDGYQVVLAADLTPNSETEDLPTSNAAEIEDLPYLAEIDGLRAVAIIPVVLYHFELGVPSGYTGVDVFFIISGYLITGILLRDMSSGRVWPITFWIRRVRRLFPALAVLLAVLLLLGWFIFLAETYKTLAKEMSAVLLLVANFYFALGEFDYMHSGVSKPLLHCWSLAVEEQFYLVYPLLLQLLWLSRRAWCVKVVLVAMCLISLAVAIVKTPVDVKVSFYLLPARAWELLLGGLLALKYWETEKPLSLANRIRAEVASWTGLAMIVTSYFLFTEDTPYPSYRALLPCLGAVLFIAAQSPSLTSCGYILSTQPLVFVGKISYSWYLWHWPTFVLLTYLSGQSEQLLTLYWKAIGVTASFLAAVLSYCIVEPAFRSTTKVPTKLLAPLVIMVWLALISSSIYFSYSDVGGIRGVAKPIHVNETIKDILSHRFRPTRASANMSINDTAVEAERAHDRRQKILKSTSEMLGTHGIIKNATTLIGTTTRLPNSTEKNASNNPVTKGPEPGQSSISTSLIPVTSNSASNASSSISTTIHDFQASSTCMVFLSDAEIDQLYNVPSTSLTIDNVLASSGVMDDQWDCAKKPPLCLGPCDSPHTWNADPEILIFGSSHCGMHGQLLNRLAKEYSIRVALLCMYNTPGTKIFDPGRIELIRSWKLKLAVWFELWVAYAWPWNVERQFNWTSTMEQMGTLADRILVFGDVPLLSFLINNPFGAELKHVAHTIYGQSGNFDRLMSLKESDTIGPKRRHLEATIDMAMQRAIGGRGRFVKTASYFRDETTRNLQLFDPLKGTLAYFDDNHLTPDGSQRLDQLFRREIFGQKVCDELDN